MILKKFLDFYKFPILLSIFVSVAIIALTVQKNPLQITFIILGSLIGAFFLDLDYVLHAYFLEPEDEFSKNFQGFVKHKDIKGLASYVHYHRNDIKEKVLNSALFQIVLAGASVLVVYSLANNFTKALVLSAFVNSIYRLMEQHLGYKNSKEWFWAFKINIDDKKLYLYLSVLVFVLIICFSSL